MYRYPLLHIITKPYLYAFYVLLSCYYSIIASLLFHYYPITNMYVHYLKLLQDHYYIITLYYCHGTAYFLSIITSLLLHYKYVCPLPQIVTRSLLHQYTLLLPWYCILLLDYHKATFQSRCPGTGSDCSCSGHSGWPSTDGPAVESIQAQDRHFESLRTSLPMNLNYSDRPASNPGLLSC